MAKYTFKQFQAEYPDDAACLTKLMEVNYGGTEITCPACGVEKAKFHPMTKRRAFACQECGHHIYPAAGTIFHKSRTNLTKWFFAMYLMTSTRHGVAAKEVERQIGVTYKTAWRMCHELWKLMASADDNRPMKGHVEVDETFIGGKRRHNQGKMGLTNKTIIMGIAERDGLLRAGPIDDTNATTLEAHVLHNVQRGSTVSTDEWAGYNRLGKDGPYDHGTVKHSEDEWVRGEHHTQTLDGHWSLLKRAIRGTHVQVSSKHLWKYVSEFSYRRNNRASHEAMFRRLVTAFSLPRLVEP